MTLSEIINDPNYTEANAATKKAIFDKYSAADQNYTGANEATQKAIRVRFGVDVEAEKPAEPIAQPKPAEAKSFGQMFKETPLFEVPNALAGFIRGSGSIGETLMAPGDAAERALGRLFGVEMATPDRRKGMEDALRNLGADPESGAFQTGKFGAEVAGTAGVGPAIAAPLKALPIAAKIPGIIRGFETAGFAPGIKSTVGNAATRAVTGGVTGAVGAGMINPEDTGSGGVIGSTVATVAPPVLKYAGRGMGALTDRVTGRAAEVKAGKIARDVAGDEIRAIRAALAGAPQDVNAGQATAGIQRDAWQALNAMLGKTDANTVLLRQQADKRLAELAKMAEAANPTEARAIQEEAKRILQRLTGPLRDAELGAANQAATTIGQLGPKLEQKQQSYIDALRQGMPRPTPAAGTPAPGVSGIHAGTQAAQDAAAQQAGKPGWLSRGDRAQEWKQTAGMFDEIANQRRAEAGFIERQIGSLQSHGLNPLDSTPIIDALEKKIASPGTRASNTQTQILRGIVDDLKALSKANNGFADAHDLYTIRKEGLNERIASLLQGQDPKVSRQVTAKILEQVRPLIDDAIEKAGGTGWRGYLNLYSEGMKRIEQKVMAGQAAEMLDKSPQKFVDLVRKKSPSAVEDVFGTGNYDIEKQMGFSNMNTLRNIASQVERDAAMKEAASRGTDELGRILTSEQSLLSRLPNLLNRWATVSKATLEMLESKVDKKTMDILRSSATSSKQMLKVIDTLPTSERSKVLQALMNPSPTAANVGAAANRNALSEMSR